MCCRGLHYIKGSESSWLRWCRWGRSNCKQYRCPALSMAPAPFDCPSAWTRARTGPMVVCGWPVVSHMRAGSDASEHHHAGAIANVLFQNFCLLLWHRLWHRRGWSVPVDTVQIGPISCSQLRTSISWPRATVVWHHHGDGNAVLSTWTIFFIYNALLI